MKRYLLLAVVVLLAVGCGHVGKIAYQPIGDFQKWELGDGSNKLPTGTYHVYMLRGISNNMNKDFIFEIGRVHIKDGASANKPPAAFVLAKATKPIFLDPAFAKLVAKGTTFSLPLNGPQGIVGTMFIVHSDTDAPGTIRPLLYTANGTEIVEMEMLEPNTAPKVDFLDEAFQQVLLDIESDFENKYTPDGKLKP